MDQDACTRPDTNAPFASKQDAVKRLIRYHCMYEERSEENEAEEEAFEGMAQQYPTIYRNMLNKYQSLLMQESMVSGGENLCAVCAFPSQFGNYQISIVNN